MSKEEDEQKKSDFDVVSDACGFLNNVCENVSKREGKRISPHYVSQLIAFWILHYNPDFLKEGSLRVCMGKAHKADHTWVEIINTNDKNRIYIIDCTFYTHCDSNKVYYLFAPKDTQVGVIYNELFQVDVIREKFIFNRDFMTYMKINFGKDLYEN